MDNDWPQWPTFRCYLDREYEYGDSWCEYMPHTDVMTYREPNRLIVWLMDNENRKHAIVKEQASCEQIMGSLTKREVKAVELVEQGNTQEEIGDALGVKQPAISRRIQRARKRIVNVIK